MPELPAAALKEEAAAREWGEQGLLPAVQLRVLGAPVVLQAVLVMASPLAPRQDRAGLENKDRREALGDLKARKPLVEKKRCAWINESLQELRQLLVGTEVQAKLENAEVLELTVRRMQGVLPGRARGGEQLQAEASERFAASYIQCMNEVHTFVSTCQAINATIATQLLNPLLKSMPLREGSSFWDLLGDALARPPGDPR